MRRIISVWLSVLLVLLTAHLSTAAGQEKVPVSEPTVSGYFESIRHSPTQLRIFLQKMPKGADLHTHLSGAVYAESFIRWAADEGLCADNRTFDLTKCDGIGTTPVADAFTGTPAGGQLYSKLIDNFSMRNYTPGHVSGHDHFFQAFGRFGLIASKFQGRMLARVASRAAAQNVHYLEVMLSFQSDGIKKLVTDIDWHTPLNNTNFKRYHELLNQSGLKTSLVSQARIQLDETERRMRLALDCGTGSQDPACRMPIRYIAQVKRVAPANRVFAQCVLAYELFQVEKRIVGLNFVAPEDDPAALRDYDLHMTILDYLYGLRNPVNVTLHAGELTLGLVPPKHLRSHITKAVFMGHARRIGHGVDIAYETDAETTLERMAEKGVLVEILLTSNDQILKVRGPEHPFPLYMAKGVPVTLSTDDEGIERVDITNEYLKAVMDFGLDYPTIKWISRNGLEHSFLPGKSLWRNGTRKAEMIPACLSHDFDRDDAEPSPHCKDFLDANERAYIQWELEQAFVVFEKNVIQRMPR